MAGLIAFFLLFGLVYAALFKVVFPVASLLGLSGININPYISIIIFGVALIIILSHKEQRE